MRSGAGVQETFQNLLSLAVVLQLVPFLYMFGALMKFAVKGMRAPQGYTAGPLCYCSPAQRPSDHYSSASCWRFSRPSRSLRCGSTNHGCSAARCFFVGLAAFFFFVYGRHKAARQKSGTVQSGRAHFSRAPGC
jgi:hypothetical protein